MYTCACVCWHVRCIHTNGKLFVHAYTYCIVHNGGGMANLAKQTSFANIFPSQIPDLLNQLKVKSFKFTNVFHTKTLKQLICHQSFPLPLFCAIRLLHFKHAHYAHTYVHTYLQQYITVGAQFLTLQMYNKQDHNTTDINIRTLHLHDVCVHQPFSQYISTVLHHYCSQEVYQLAIPIFVQNSGDLRQQTSHGSNIQTIAIG